MSTRSLGHEVPVIEFLVEFFMPLLSLGVRFAVLDVLDLKLAVDLAVQDFHLTVLELVQVLRERVFGFDPALAHDAPLILDWH
ncbi:hypothetical protein BJ994_001654 [Arthrobacter pigmenti]|uniref:Uncharacterized protein n=1 Tax=Arthrobacter pigmenti TaxID=271432 RepID=A0A846RH59_9MICC|nr:hypothetical protein [Arthrobacter pigmenti]NJC22578.1 hypothetical protein [Arthrobacter pigmenti]